jgi:hypothetical protein
MKDWSFCFFSVFTVQSFCPLAALTHVYCLLSAAMSNQEVIETGKKQMDETDQTIERSKKVGHPGESSSPS